MVCESEIVTGECVRVVRVEVVRWCVRVKIVTGECVRVVRVCYALTSPKEVSRQLRKTKLVSARYL